MRSLDNRRGDSTRPHQAAPDGRKQSPESQELGEDFQPTTVCCYKDTKRYSETFFPCFFFFFFLNSGKTNENELERKTTSRLQNGK